MVFWRSSRLALAGGVLLATPLIALACGAFGADDPPGELPDREMDAAVATDGPSDGGPLACNDKPYDHAGCLCAASGAVGPCYHGVPGPDSGCVIAGSQTCAPAGGELRWSACLGGTEAVAEVCHNGIDDNCDGKVDENCPCTNTFDLCRDDAGTTYPTGAYTIFTIPAQPRANVPFDLYLVTKDKPIINPGLNIGGSFCAGGGSSKACATVGPNCQGWKVTFEKAISRPAGSYNMQFLDPQGEAGCEGPKIANKTIVVQ